MAVTALAEPDLLAYAGDLADELQAGVVRGSTGPTWRDRSPRARTGRGRSPHAVEDGDAGIAWALAELGRTLDRSDLLDLAVDASSRTLDGAARGGGVGLLTGLAGVACAVHRVGAAADSPELRQRARRAAASVRTDPRRHDLATGTAGHLLGLLVCEAPATAVTAATRRLRTAARHLSANTVCWPDADGRARTGLAHGTSGVILALAEAAARHPVLATDLVPLIDGGLRWESAWFEPEADAWSTPGSGPTGAPAAPSGHDAHATGDPWTGPVGIGLTRLRLLALRDQGLELATPRTNLVADVHAAVRASTRTARATTDLSLGHGAAGTWDLLASAAVGLDTQGYRSAAVDLAHEALAAHGTTVPGQGDDAGPGLLSGIAGTALALTAVATPRAGSASRLFLAGR
ncbi:lanthionine synthetase LanC family protein [Occultella aeris]|uniref:Lanthionine synthetase C-like protein n=1 Tax=Occultella aeris TaxID=2761496 RepID=A0A7M4DH93_9MICO|nr:lanthionine synthetase LanC family protein [Occultella aeris]VZO36286.1 Lanthionine synthetase C-like protein [Occultella aeris]